MNTCLLTAEQNGWEYNWTGEAVLFSALWHCSFSLVSFCSSVFIYKSTQVNNFVNKSNTSVDVMFCSTDSAKHIKCQKLGWTKQNISLWVGCSSWLSPRFYLSWCCVLKDIWSKLQQTLFFAPEVFCSTHFAFIFIFCIAQQIPQHLKGNITATILHEWLEFKQYSLRRARHSRHSSSDKKLCEVFVFEVDSSQLNKCCSAKKKKPSFCLPSFLPMNSAGL